jgi:hypothetical protein
MKMSSWRLAMAAGLLSLSGLAQATLEKQTVNGVNLVYDPDSDRTWVQDANLFETQYTADNTIVSGSGGIIDTVGSVAGHTLTSSDFITSGTYAGTMTWWGAMAWVEWLNATGYGGADNWGLPSALNANGTGPCGGYPCTGSDLGNLFYTVGGLSGGDRITDSSILTAAFTNLQDYVYWSGTEYAPYPLRVALQHRRWRPGPRR